MPGTYTVPGFSMPLPLFFIHAPPRAGFHTRSVSFSFLLRCPVPHAECPGQKTPPRTECFRARTRHIRAESVSFQRSEAPSKKVGAVRDAPPPAIRFYKVPCSSVGQRAGNSLNGYNRMPRSSSCRTPAPWRRQALLFAAWQRYNFPRYMFPRTPGCRCCQKRPR